MRSVTLTSMMFMMPMPPTTSDTAATPPSSIVMVELTLETREMMSLLLRMVKSSAWLAERLVQCFELRRELCCHGRHLPGVGDLHARSS